MFIIELPDQKKGTYAQDSAKVLSKGEKWKVSKKCAKLKNQKYLCIELIKVDIFY